MKNILQVLRAIAATALLAFPGLAVHATTFGPEIRIVNNGGPSVYPNVAAVGSNVYVVWSENIDFGSGYVGQIWFSRSTDNGVSFSVPVQLTNTPSRQNFLPVIAAAGTQVHIYWTDSGTVGETYYRRSTDSGANFFAEVQLTPTDGHYSVPQGALVDASGNVHLAYYDNTVGFGQVYYRCSQDAGANYSATVSLSQFDGQVDQESPRITQGTDGTLYMIVRTTRAGLPQGGFPPFEQYVLRTAAPVTTCGSVQWMQPPQKLSRGLPEEFANTFGSNIFAGANNVLHAAYWSDKLGTNLIYRRGFPNGKGWEAPIDISGHGPNHLEWDGTVPGHTSFGLGEDAAGKLHAVFGENNHLREGFQVGPLYYRCSNDTGVTWASRQNVNAQTEMSQPRGVYANNKFHMVWMDWRDSNFGAEIYYRNVTTGSCGSSVATDLNGDAKSDILYRNTSTGQVYRISMNGFSIVSAGFAYNEPNTAWKIVADGDFNGDGITDLLYRNDVNGQVFMLLMNSSGVPTGGALVYAEPNLAWKIIGAPDLNGDGKADILYWNSSTGQVYALLMNGFSSIGQGTVYNEPNTAWQIAAVADFSGSGKKNQLLYRNNSNGQIYLVTATWTGSNFTTTGQLIYVSNLQYRIVGTPDFNGDGKSDILWRNSVDGRLYMMLMNGAVITTEGVIYQEPNLAWEIVATGDYNGDGKADILYRNNSNGQVYMMLMNGMSVSVANFVYTEPNTAWAILGTWEYGKAVGTLP